MLSFLLYLFENMFLLRQSAERSVRAPVDFALWKTFRILDGRGAGKNNENLHSFLPSHRLSEPISTTGHGCVGLNGSNLTAEKLLL